MSGKTNLKIVLKEMKPFVNKGEYVFVSVKSVEGIDREEIICEFKESEGITIIVKKEIADKLNFKYDFVGSWIILKVHSSLSAVGLTAAFSSELAKHNISCNIIAGYYHDHIFIDKKDESKAIELLNRLSENQL